MIFSEKSKVGDAYDCMKVLLESKIIYDSLRVYCGRHFFFAYISGHEIQNVSYKSRGTSHE